MNSAQIVFIFRKSYNIASVQNILTMTKLKNKSLQEALELLCKEVFPFYKKTIPPPDTSPPNPIYPSYFLFQLEDKVKEFGIFMKCVKIMENNPQIKTLLRKLVGTALGKSSVGGAEECIFSFINRLYIKNNVFDQPLFNENYENFEELFYDDELHLIDNVRLYNFESDLEEVVLEPGLRIKKSILKQDDTTKFEEAKYKPHIQFSRSDYVIERDYKKKKRIGEASAGEDEINKEARESGELFDLVVKALRLLKSSAVYRDHAITTEIVTFMTYGGISSRFPFAENTVFGDKCKIASSDVKELVEIFTLLKRTSNQVFRISSNRLSFGIERRLYEDKLLDFMIGLEALYLPDGNDELTLRLSLRVAFLLEETGPKRKELFEFIKKMYKLRSKIVHGNTYNLTKEEVIRLEEILRLSLKKWLTDPSNFSIDKYNDRGELTTEGLLDKKYFD